MPPRCEDPGAVRAKLLEFVEARPPREQQQGATAARSCSFPRRQPAGGLARLQEQQQRQQTPQSEGLPSAFDWLIRREQEIGSPVSRSAPSTPPASMQDHRTQQLPVLARPWADNMDTVLSDENDGLAAVSYTHLTLPTICSV